MKLTKALLLIMFTLVLSGPAQAHSDCSLPDEEGVPGPGDEDLDGICDDEDNCLTTRNPGQEDADDDLIGDLCDACFGDNAAGDRDADLYCGAADCDDSNPRVHVGAPELCDGLNNDCVDGLPAAELDDDEDGSPNCNDLCIGRDGFGDIDRDGFCGDIDLCDGDDALGDLDEDGVCEDLDQCEGDDESGDDDLDGVCTDLDVCLGDDASGDADTDGVCDDSDLCEGDDTSGDSDDDGVCDAIDICFGDDATRDADEDGVCGDRDCRDDRTDTRPPSPAGAAGIEVCDGVDQNCDGIVDDNPEALCSIGAVCAIGECTSLKPCYADIDNDGFGDANNVILVEQGADCPNRRVLSGTDCDDSPLNCGAACGPGLQEACDGFDNDCSGLVDDTAPSCPDDENGVGTCSDGTCSLACSEGWQEVGESCLDVNECDAGPCGVDELCTNLDGGFECACAIGFAGDDGCRAVCGDSLRVSTEECDDGNATGGDGCSADCTAEQGWTCTTGCTEDCGDGLLVGFEACDDGNSNEGDGCSSACAVETNYECSGAPSACVESQLCGNGVLDVGEDCDDANFWEDDGCLADCTVDEGYTCDDGPNGWSECVESEPQSGSADDGGCASTRAARFHWWTVLAGLILLRRRQLPNQAAVE